MADADFNVIDAVTDDCAVDTMEAMDVEPAQSLEGKPVDTVKPDQSLMQRRPFDDRHEDFDNDTPVPGSNSVKVESEDEVKPAKESEDEAYLFLNKVWTNLQAAPSTNAWRNDNDPFVLTNPGEIHVSSFKKHIKSFTNPTKPLSDRDCC